MQGRNTSPIGHHKLGNRCLPSKSTAKQQPHIPFGRIRNEVEQITSWCRNRKRSARLQPHSRTVRPRHSAIVARQTRTLAPFLTAVNFTAPPDNASVFNTIDIYFKNLILL